MPATLAGTGRAVGGRCYNATMAMFLVMLRRSGPEWDAGRPMEEQSGWEAHAAFMDALVDAGFLRARWPAGRRPPGRARGRG